MLILSRKKNETIIINDNITITVLQSTSSSVKLGIEAPDNVNIYRKELYEAIRNENIRSSKETDIKILLQHLPKDSKK